ncbi:MAG: B12-binding domain-containing radical SAM protein [Parasporobacterium sp.]|nr:B12-binding domain-containing radical SAM protein [Parasporobacterium sp.]
MKILLCAVNAKYIHSNPAIHILQAYSKSFAEAENVEIEVAEYSVNNRPEEVLADIYLRHPDVAAFSCYIWNWEYVRLLLSDLHSVKPELDIWAGGPEVSFDAERVLGENPDIKGVIVGEGEVTFKELAIDHYGRMESDRENAVDLKHIKGICYRSGDETVFTGNRSLMDMDEVPFIYDSEDICLFDHKILYYESSRGCPFSCSYCLSSVDKAVRFRSLEKVYSELQFFLDNKVPQVKFIDRTFNIRHEHSLGILKYIREHDNGITNFHFEIAADLLSDEELEVMSDMRPGLIQLEIGVQSANTDTIKAVNRVMDLDKLTGMVRAVREMNNIHQHLDLIAGLPYEDYASFARSFNVVYAMKPSQLQLGFLKVLKGSPMEEAAGKYGIIYKNRAPYEVLCTKWLTFEDVLRLKRIEEMVEIFYNSHQFTAALGILEKAFTDAFSMFEQLADHYRDKGYFINTPSRIYRYNVLLEFASMADPEHEQLYRQALTFDLYYRENMKSRPEFAPDITMFREQIRNLRADRQIHIDVFDYDFTEWDADTIPKRSEKPVFTAFDYEKRDPLYGNSTVSVLHVR